MKVTFNLPIEPFSVNRMYYRDRRHKSQDYRDWEMTVVSALSVPYVQEQLKKIRESFNAKKHGLLVRFTYMFPEQILYNKAGEISSRAEDLTNIEKPLLDILCLPKFHVQSPPFGCANLNCDDKHVLRLISSKKVSNSNKYFVQISVALVALPKLVVGP
jgi:Holliday junction resolvase RusA-like endonuclease